MSRPLLWIAVAMATGCLSGGGLSARVGLLLLGLGGCVLLLALVAPGRSALAALLGAALSLGAAGAQLEARAYAATPLLRWLEGRGDIDEPVGLLGRASADGFESGGRGVLIVDVERIVVDGAERPMWGRVRVQVSGLAARTQIGEGDTLRIWATLHLPRGFGNPGSFDAEEQARGAGVHAIGSCKSPLLVERTAAGGAGSLALIAARVRAWARAQLQRYVIPGPEQGLVRAMTLGDRTGVDRETGDAFRIAGTYHVLALSGAQVALLAGLLLAGTRRLGWGPALTAPLVTAALALYAVFVGGDTPVVRAAVMAGVMLLGRSLDLDADLANLLGFAAFVLLLHRPSAVHDVAFQLSFVATLGILLLTDPLRAGWPRLPLRLETALAGSLAAQAPLLPLLAAHFHRVAPAALLLNLVAVPLSGAVLLAGFAVLAAAAAVPPLAPRVGDLAWMAAHGLLRSADLAREVPQLDVRVPAPPFWAVAVLIAGLVPLARGRRRGLGLAALGACGIVFGPVRPGGDGRLHLTVLDVGQGDALILRSPSGRVWVVDAGAAYEGGFDLGEAVVGPYLWSQGVRGFDRLLLTHAHPDHVGGARFLLSAFGVGEVWEGPAPRHDAVYAALVPSLERVARRGVARGVGMTWDGVSIEVLGPRPAAPRWRVRNDDSVVMALRLGDVRLLLTGDMERGEEAGLSFPSCAVVKVPHHGSRTSSTPEFLNAARPQVAIVSAGLHNHFGHPHPEVVARYGAAGALVMRTDRDGAVEVATDGRRIWLRSYRSGLDLLR
jgi:competence protein ComEC